MAMTVRGCLTTQSQSEGDDEPETILNTPQQEGQPDVAVGEDIADYDPDVGYEGSEPKVEPVAQEQKRYILMQNMQKWKCPEMGPSARE